MAEVKRKKLKNQYSKWSKKSPYKTLQLLECFARDLSINDAARLIKMSERTVRDRYADLRGKLLSWVMEYPDRFNGFGHLLLDPDGSINLYVLTVLLTHSQSHSFKQRMKKRYPKFKTENDPALNHVIELAVRRFTTIEAPKTDENFRKFVQAALSSAKSETYLHLEGRNFSNEKTQLRYWKTAHWRLRESTNYRPRKFPNTIREAFFRDLKYCLRLDPI